MKPTTTIEAATMDPSTVTRATRLVQVIEAGSDEMVSQENCHQTLRSRILPVTQVKVEGEVIEVTSQLDTQISVQCIDDVTALDVFVDARESGVPARF